MALDNSRLGLENEFLENKSGRIFCVRKVYLPTNLGACKPTFYTFYTSHLRWNSTLRHCFYHTDLGQNAVFQNFTIQINLSGDNFKKYSASMGRDLRTRYGQVILVSGYPVLTAVNWSQHWCAICVQYQFLCAPKLARKCKIERWFPCAANGRSAGGVRSRDYQIFWDRYIYLAMELCSRALHAREAVDISWHQNTTTTTTTIYCTQLKQE